MTTCCPTNLPPAAKADYTGDGKTLTLLDAETYVSGDETSSQAIVLLTDIFGFGHQNPYQVSDLLAKEGFYVVAPDFWRGRPWPTSNFPPKEGMEGFMEWINTTGSFESALPLLKAAFEHVKEKSPEAKVGILGFCWGARAAFGASGLQMPSAIASCHPSLLTPELAAGLSCPACILPSKDEDTLDFVKEAVEKNEAGVWQRFDDQPHGWCSARGTFPAKLTKSAAQSNRTAEALLIVAEFFTKTLA